MKLANNIMNNSKEEKFRTIKKTNKAIQSKLLSLEGGIDKVIEGMGFTNVDEEHYVYVGDVFHTLKAGVKLTDVALEPVKVKYMSEEERTKHYVLKEQKAAYEAKRKEDQARIDAAQRQAGYDRTEKNKEEVKSIKGRQLKYGANVKKFEPPVKQRGG
jgi:hypothetical protein